MRVISRRSSVTCIRVSATCRWVLRPIRRYVNLGMNTTDQRKLSFRDCGPLLFVEGPLPFLDRRIDYVSSNFGLPGCFKKRRNFGNLIELLCREASNENRSVLLTIVDVERESLDSVSGHKVISFLLLNVVVQLFATGATSIIPCNHFDAILRHKNLEISEYSP